MTLEEIIKAAIKAALERNNGNITAAAKQLQIARSTMYRYVKEIQHEDCLEFAMRGEY